MTCASKLLVSKLLVSSLPSFGSAHVRFSSEEAKEMEEEYVKTCDGRKGGGSTVVLFQFAH